MPMLPSFKAVNISVAPENKLNTFPDPLCTIDKRVLELEAETVSAASLRTKEEEAIPLSSSASFAVSATNAVGTEPILLRGVISPSLATSIPRYKV